MIETVLGSLPPAELDVNNTNEHVLTDCRNLCRPNRESEWLEGTLRPEILEICAGATRFCRMTG